MCECEKDRFNLQVTRLLAWVVKNKVMIEMTRMICCKINATNDDPHSKYLTLTKPQLTMLKDYDCKKSSSMNQIWCKYSLFYVVTQI